MSLEIGTSSSEEVYPVIFNTDSLLDIHATIVSTYCKLSSVEGSCVKISDVFIVYKLINYGSHFSPVVAVFGFNLHHGRLQLFSLMNDND